MNIVECKAPPNHPPDTHEITHAFERNPAPLNVRCYYIGGCSRLSIYLVFCEVQPNARSLFSASRLLNSSGAYSVSKSSSRIIQEAEKSHFHMQQDDVSKQIFPSID